MKADPTAQLRLLDLQELDAQAGQLRHQRAHLPDDAEIATLAQQRAALVNAVRDQQIVVTDLTSEQEKADADVEQVKARRERDRDRMDQGLITNPKDLERMQHELQTLERRISVLEDEELEVMARLEDAERDLTTHRGDLAAVEEKLESLTTARDTKRSEIDAELHAVEDRRAPVVAEIPGDLLALYDKLRASKGGVGAAALRARQCGGCRLTLDPAELARIKGLPDDEVVRCEECQRILVRTSESGL